MRDKTGVYVQFGAGATAPDGWLNFDNSPTLRLARLPLLGRLVPSPFPKSVIYGDIVRGLPVADGTVDGVFSSHVLEHLYRADFDTALLNTFRMLKAGGRFRLVVPDLEGRVDRYIAAKNSRKTDANDEFLRQLHVCTERGPSSVAGRLRSMFGNSWHRWMWDYASMHSALTAVGFTDVRKSQFADSSDPMFALVEHEDRYRDSSGIEECAVECVRP